jgi:hypothetical protein
LQRQPIAPAWKKVGHRVSARLPGLGAGDNLETNRK